MLLCKNCVTIVTIYNNPLHFRDQNRKYIHFYSLPDLDLMMWPWQQNIKVLSEWAHRYLSIAAVHVPLRSLVRKIAGVPLLVPPPCSGSRVANYPSGCRVSLRCVLYAYVTLWQSERLISGHRHVPVGRCDQTDPVLTRRAPPADNGYAIPLEHWVQGAAGGSAPETPARHGCHTHAQTTITINITTKMAYVCPSAVEMVCTKVRLDSALISIFWTVDKSKHVHSKRIDQSYITRYEDASEYLWFSKY